MNIKRNNKIIPCTVPDNIRTYKFEKFVDFFNKFINHRRKTRRPFVAKDMRL